MAGTPWGRQGQELSTESAGETQVEEKWLTAVPRTQTAGLGFCSWGLESRGTYEVNRGVHLAGTAAGLWGAVIMTAWTCSWLWGEGSPGRYAWQPRTRTGWEP